MTRTRRIVSRPRHDHRAARAIDDPVVKRRTVRVHAGRASALFATVVAGTALGYCTVACDDSDRKEFKQGAAITGGLVFGLFGLLVLTAAAH